MIKVGRADVFVGVQEVPGNRVIGKVECNPSRVDDPDGWAAVGLGEARSRWLRCIKAAGELVNMETAAAEHRVKRLDVCRDLVTEDAAWWVRGLAPLRRTYARWTTLGADPGLGGIQSLRVGSGSGLVRLYDKHEEKAAAPAGVLRWEAEARSRWSENYGGMRLWGDVTDERVERLARDRWDWSAMGTEVGGEDLVLDRIEQLHDPRTGARLTPAKQRSLMGYVWLVTTGRAAKVSRNTHAEYARLLRAAGVTVAWGQKAETPASFARLDYDAGVEVLRVA